MTGSAVLLLMLLFTTHFLGDFTPLATARMQKAKAAGRPFGPIAAHAGVHAVLIGIVVGLAAWPGISSWALAIALVFTTHLAIDWAKGCLGAAHPKLVDPETQVFWSFLGIDQLAHGLVLIWIASLVL